METPEQQRERIAATERRYKEAFPHPENCLCDECMPVEGPKQ